MGLDLGKGQSSIWFKAWDLGSKKVEVKWRERGYSDLSFTHKGEEIGLLACSK
jgi:hypothetical protein